MAGSVYKGVLPSMDLAVEKNMALLLDAATARLNLTANHAKY